jgi:methyltransferase (TIGR00027 family)
MKRGTPSSTAQAAAAVRALESLLPAGEKLFDDPYASCFLKTWHRGLLKLCAKNRAFRDFVEARLEKAFPGVPGDFICRTRVIDDYLLKALGSDLIERLVILGAGYDTRYLRIASPRGLPVTELDHPDTQAFKRGVLEKLAGKNSSLSSVSQDLIDEPKEFASVTGQNERIFWILEGVTGYLPSNSLDRLLAWIARNSAPGSSLVLTYVHQSWVDGTADDPSAQVILQHLKKSGEPFLSGWRPETLKEQCAQNGIKIVEDQSEAEWASRYPELSKRKLRFLTGFRIARGVISP